MTDAVPPSKPFGLTVPPPALTLNDAQFARLLDVTVNEYALSRAALVKGMTDPRRDIDDECGYPKRNPSPQEYLDLDDRNPIANRVNEVYAVETWKVTPEVYEDEDPETQTPFEEAWDNLGRFLYPDALKPLVKTEDPKGYYQDEKSNPVWDYLMRLDVQAGIGRYGVLLLGLNDGKALNEPAVRREGQRLTYLRVFSEALAQITVWETDTKSPRYGRPLKYLLKFNDTRENQTGLGVPTVDQEVHWTRVIHFADGLNTSSNEVYGKERCRKVLRELLGLEKLYGASPEAFWKACLPILSWETHPSLGAEAKYNVADMKRMSENLVNGLQRSVVTSGFGLKAVSGPVTDPTPHIAAAIEAICVQLAIPVPVFKGYEIGEQASENNDESWDKRVSQRQNRTATPRIVVPFASRLIDLGVLPEPAGISVVWPDLHEESSKDEAANALSKAQTLTALEATGDVLLSPHDKLVDILGYTDEEAAQRLENAEEAEQDKLEKQADQQTQMIEAGLQADPMAEPGVEPVALNPGQQLVKPDTGETVAEAKPLKE